VITEPITDNVYFWIAIYVSEFSCLGVIKLFQSMKEKINKNPETEDRFRRIIATITLVVYSAVIVLYIWGATVILKNDPQLMFFWITALFTVGILIISTYVSVILNKKSNDKLGEILDRIKRIEERLDGLHKK
jgi:formate-dependent nitrite reductase membrane component NrfD